MRALNRHRTHIQLVAQRSSLGKGASWRAIGETTFQSSIPELTRSVDIQHNKRLAVMMFERPIGLAFVS
jgi:hypothetical protein